MKLRTLFPKVVSVLSIFGILVSSVGVQNVSAATKACFTNVIYWDNGAKETWMQTNVVNGGSVNFPSIAVLSDYFARVDESGWDVIQDGSDGNNHVWGCYNKAGTKIHYFTQSSLHDRAGLGWWFYTSAAKNDSSITADLKSAPIKERQGFIFKGLYKDTKDPNKPRKDVVNDTKPPKFTTAYTDGRKLTFGQGIGADKPASAWWKISNYNVAVNPNGGVYNGTTAVTTTSHSYTANVTIPASTRTNWTFTGYDVAYGTGGSRKSSESTLPAGVNPAPLSFKKACRGSGTVTLTAQWKGVCNLNYNKPANATGAISGNAVTSKSFVNPTSAMTFGAFPTPSLTGWIFNGWFTAPTGGTQVLATTGVLPYGNCTLYAHWTPIQYTVTYSKGSTDSTANAPAPSTVYYDSDWSTGAVGSLTGRSYQIDYKGNVPSTSSTKDSLRVSKDQDKGNLPLEALFWGRDGTANSYAASTTVSKPNFTTTNGGSVNVTGRYTTQTFPLPTATLTGWTCTGWYTAATGGTKQETGTTVAPATTAHKSTLYAQWRNNRYQIRYNGNTNTGGTMANDEYIWDNTSEEKLSRNKYVKKYTISFNARDVNDGVDVGSSSKVCNWSFQNWAEQADGSGATYTDGQSIHNLTPVDNAVIDIYAQWKCDGITLPKITKAGSKFLGWFTKEQGNPKNPTTAQWIGGGPGWDYTTKVDFEEVTTLYAWFNEYPVYSNIDTNTFYQHQPVSAEQLLWLIDIKDYENDYIKNILSLSASAGMTAVEKKELLSAANPNKLKVKVTGVDYLKNGKKPDGSYASDRVPFSQSSASVYSDGLLTGSDPMDPTYIGDIVVHYTVTDEGTYNGTSLIEDSPITLDYEVNGTILWNYSPEISITDRYLFIDDGTTKDNIEEYLLEYQTVKDKEDNVDNDAWWTGTVTTENLEDSVALHKVYDTTVSSSLEYTDPGAAEMLKGIDNIEDLFKLKATNYDIFKYVTSFKVVVDCVDQWGKTSSMEHSDEDRSIQVVLINDESDPDVVNAFVKQNIRYVNGKWVNTLGSTYWGTYGQSKLNDVLNKYSQKGTLNKELYSGEYYDKNGRKVKVSVNDYSN